MVGFVEQGGGEILQGLGQCVLLFFFFFFFFLYTPTPNAAFFFFFQGCEADKKHSSGGPRPFLTRLSVTLSSSPLIHFFSPPPTTSTPLSSFTRLCLSALFSCPLIPHLLAVHTSLTYPALYISLYINSKHLIFFISLLNSQFL